MPISTEDNASGRLRALLVVRALKAEGELLVAEINQLFVHVVAVHTIELILTLRERRGLVGRSAKWQKTTILRSRFIKPIGI